MIEKKQEGRLPSKFEFGRWPWKIRPAGIGTGGRINIISADAGVSGSNTTPSTPTLVYGAPVEIVGMPDFNTYPSVEMNNVALTASASAVYDGAPVPPRISGFQLAGSGMIGLVLYQNGNKIDLAWGGGGTYYQQMGSFTLYERVILYGWDSSYTHKDYGIEFNNTIQGDSINLLSVPPQAWDPPYVPDAIGLFLRIQNCSASFNLRCSFIWTS